MFLISSPFRVGFLGSAAAVVVVLVAAPFTGVDLQDAVVQPSEVRSLEADLNQVWSDQNRICIELLELRQFEAQSSVWLIPEQFGPWNAKTK